MNTLQRTGIALGVGGAVYAFSPGGALNSDIYPMAQEMNTRVEACAHRLGGVALSTDVLPRACEQYQQSFLAAEANTDEGFGDAVDADKTYVLPAHDDFLQEHLVGSEDVELAVTERREFSMSMGALAAVATFRILTIRHTRSRYEDEKARPEEY